MVRVNVEGIEPVRRYGLEHFMNKFGLNDDTSSVIIGYGFKSAQDSSYVRISKNDMSKRIEGAVHYCGEAIPLFETPIKSDCKGETLATFSNGLEEYPVVIKTDNGIEIGFDIFNEVGNILSGFLEQYWSGNSMEKKYLARKPLVDIYEKVLLDCVEKIYRLEGKQLLKKPIWPEGKKFVVALSHDVDLYRKTVQYFSHSLRYIQSGDVSKGIRQLTGFLKAAAVNPYWNIESMIELERQLGVKSSTYFLNQKPVTTIWHPGMKLLELGACRFDSPSVIAGVKQLHANGWEVGLHQSLESYDDEELLKGDKKELETILGENVLGVRQHYLKMHIPDFWYIKEKGGFKYDSTVGFTTLVGFRSSTSFPFFVFDIIEGQKLNIIEIPLIIMEENLLSSDKDPFEICKEIIDSVEKYNGVLTILWHQRFLNQNEFPEYYELYIKLIKYCQMREAWITSLDEVYNWWVGR